MPPSHKGLLHLLRDLRIVTRHLRNYAYYRYLCVIQVKVHPNTNPVRTTVPGWTKGCIRNGFLFRSTDCGAYELFRLLTFQGWKLNLAESSVRPANGWIIILQRPFEFTTIPRPSCLSCQPLFARKGGFSAVLSLLFSNPGMQIAL